MKFERTRKPDDPLVIVGTGPAGVTAAERILGRNPRARIVLYGDEPWDPYNRVRLSSYLAGEVSESDLSMQPDALSDSRIEKRYNRRIVAIDRESRRIRDEHGEEQAYSALILATGSRAHIPDIAGIDTPGVYTFRNMSDAVALMGIGGWSRSVVILGGGVLGLEAAKAIQRFAGSVTVIEQNRHLMFRQLDESGAAYLLRHVESLGIRVRLAERIARVNGGGNLHSVTLGGGDELECDTLILAAGIRPNTGLALECGLKVNRGIRVDDRMRTSDHHIYAVGECAEHRDITYGLVAPCYDQAAVAAHNVSGGHAFYRGSIAATSLKVLGLKVFSMGLIAEDPVFALVRGYVYEDAATGVYRKLLIRRGHLTGVISIGQWSQISRIQEAVAGNRRIWSWQLRDFTRTGQLWSATGDDSVAAWPETAVICNCTGVTRGQIGKCIASGCNSVAGIAAATNASTVCGSCKPLLQQLCADTSRPEPVFGWRALAVTAGLALLLALLSLLGPDLAYSKSVRVAWQWDVLWRESLFKQISGFTLIGLMLLTLGLSLRKRFSVKVPGRFDVWRIVHTAAGLTALAVLAAHSGFRIGHNLNLLLMTSFIGVMVAGSIYGGLVAFGHRAGFSAARNLKSAFGWAHILLFWPLPVLLLFHVLKTYYY